MDNRNKIFVVTGTAGVLAAAGIVGLVLFTQGNSPQTPSSATTSSSSTDNSSTSNANGAYKDGTYTATVAYRVPHGGQNNLKATVVVSSGKISSVTTSDDYTDGESGMYIRSFESEVSSDAKGQSLSTYRPSRIGGASLTTLAFSEALTNITTQAKG